LTSAVDQHRHTSEPRVVTMDIRTAFTTAYWCFEGWPPCLVEDGSHKVSRHEAAGRLIYNHGYHQRVSTTTAGPRPTTALLSRIWSDGHRCFQTSFTADSSPAGRRRPPILRVCVEVRPCSPLYTSFAIGHLFRVVPRSYWFRSP